MRPPAFAAAFAGVFLMGCATFSPDGGFNAVELIARERLDKEVKWIKNETDAGEVRAAVRKLLSGPLSADAAVQVALLNNRGLQASYAELGIAEADLVQAGRLPNPRLSYLRTRFDDEFNIESVIAFNIFALLTRPLAARIEARRFERAKLEVAAEILRVAAETRKAYFSAVAAEEAARYMDQVKNSAEAGAELARRMRAAGNWSKLNEMREQAFYAETAAGLARARQAVDAERERLVRLMGVWGSDIRFKLPERLPELPKSVREPDQVEALALAQRLDIEAAKRDTESLAESLGLTRTTRVINALEFGVARTTETPEPRKKGYEIGVELPLFDWGGARVAKAEAIYMQAVHRVADAAINARSEVREAYMAYRTTFDLARHYRDEVVPLRKRISEETLLRYNGMLASVFELLADAREQVRGVSAYIEALRDFWIADADLQMSLSGRGSGAIVRTKAPASAAPAAPAGH